MEQTPSGTFMEQTVFLSNHDDNAEDEILLKTGTSEDFCVQSVFPHVTSEPRITCAIVNESTAWIAPTNMIDEWSYMPKDILEVGDTIRIGALNSNDGLTGYSDYVVVMERVGPIDTVYNSTTESVQIGIDPQSTALGLASSYDLTTATIRDNAKRHRYMYRINSTLNATALSDYLPNTQNDGTTNMNNESTTDKWWKVDEKSGITLVNRLTLDPNPHQVYKLKYPKSPELKLTLDRGIGTVRQITLIGYHIKSSDSGVWDSNSEAQDYYTLKIKELQGAGGVISNKPTPNGCFAVLSAGHSAHRTIGAVEYEMHDSVSGIATTLWNSSQPLKTLTVEVLNMKGELAKVNKIHLWFKLLTTSC